MSGLLGRVTGVFASSTGRLKRAEALIAKGDRAAAFKELTPLAQEGNERAEYLVGRAYLEGAGVPPSAVVGTFWLERAAGHGNLDATSLLAALYVQGMAGPDASRGADAGGLSRGRPSAALFSTIETPKPDFDRALIWARRAASGCSNGQDSWRHPTPYPTMAPNLYAIPCPANER